MKERTFQNEIRESINYFYPGSHYKKIADPSRQDAMKTQKRPYDAFYLDQNKFIALEYKMVKEPKSFSFDSVENHQIYNLMEVKQNFHHGLILINYRFQFDEKQMKKYKTEKSKHNFVVCFRVNDFLELKHLYHDYLKRESIPFEYIFDLYSTNSCMIVPWRKFDNKYFWDIKEIFEIL